MARSKKTHRLATDERAVGPAISTTILTSAIIVMILITIVFANNYLNARLAENELGAMKQFMQTVGLQIDNVAWIIGSTQTIRYASRFGQVGFQPIFLSYNVTIDGISTIYVTRILMFSIPTSSYNIGNDYYERIMPVSDDSFLQWGMSAPVSHVYVVERLPMYDGSYVRVVVAPCIRALNSTISTGTGLTNSSSYTKLYLPILIQSNHTGSSQSVTLSGTRVSVNTQGMNTYLQIDVGFPNETLGFNNAFFKFTNTTVTPTVPSGSIVEFYTGEVSTSLGS